MKKILCLLVAALASLQMLLAVPNGVYCDDNGIRKVIVQYDTIYCLDRDGNVRSTYTVVREDANGRFYVKLVYNGQAVGAVNSNNAWWSENGKIYLNLDNQRGTLVKE